MSDKPTIVKANTRYGNMLCFQNDTIGKSLSEYGEYCHPEIDLILKNVDRNSFFLDIGANIGTHSIGVAPYINRVMSFEPDPSNHDLLVKNVAMAGLKNITVNNIALGDSAFKCGTNFNYGKTKLSVNGEIICTKLDNIKGFPSIDFIKIDVEGMEFNVLKGANNTLAYFKPKMLIEVQDVAMRPYIFDFLKEHNYYVYWFLCPTDPEDVEEKIFGADHGVANWFCNIGSDNVGLEPVVDRDDSEERFIYRQTRNT